MCHHCTFDGRQEWTPRNVDFLCYKFDIPRASNMMETVLSEEKPKTGSAVVFLVALSYGESISIFFRCMYL